MDSKFVSVIDQLHDTRKNSGVNVNGKLYSMVKDRIELFRRNWGDSLGIDTNVDWNGTIERGTIIVAKARVFNAEGMTLASGHAMVEVGKDEVSSNAPIEAVETAAIGRALACFGLHGGEFASAEEMGKVKPEAQSNRLERDRFNNGTLTVTSGLYIPPDDDATWNAPFPHLDNVLKELNTTSDGRKLSMYWNELAAFRKLIETQAPNELAGLKAAFATATARTGKNN